MFCCSFKEKCPLSGAKTQVKYVNTGMFLKRRYRYVLLCIYYVATGTYCDGSEFKYPGSVPKSECSIKLEICPTPKPTLDLPDGVNKCKTDIKHICWCNRAISTSLYVDLNCFVEPWLHRIRTGAPPLLSTSPYSVSYWTNLPSIKTHRYEAGYMRC